MFLIFILPGRPYEFVCGSQEKRRVRSHHLGSVQRREQREEVQSDAQLLDRRARAHAQNV